MAGWLFKTEPSDFSYRDLEREGSTVWDGVRNNWALEHLRAVRRGDRTLIYHTGTDRAIIGEAAVASDPYPDPRSQDPRFVVVDVEPIRAWDRPVTLTEIKADPAFSDFDLVRFSRLAVMPVPLQVWQRLERMATRSNT